MSDSRGAKMAQSKSIEEEWCSTWQQAKLLSKRYLCEDRRRDGKEEPRRKVGSEERGDVREPRGPAEPKGDPARFRG